MLRSICVLIALCAVVFAQSTSTTGSTECPSFECVGLGDACGLSNNAFKACDKSTCDSNVCKEVAALGGTCSSTGPFCYGDKYYYLFERVIGTCVGSTCGVKVPVFGPGEACSTGETLLATNLNGGCFNGVCNNSKCDVSATVNCTSNNCPAGQFCTGGLCTDWLASGADCTGGKTCAPNLLCMQNKCAAFFSSTAGGICNDAGDPNFAIGDSGIAASGECPLGLACVAGKCADPDDGISGKSCSGDGDCGGSVANAFACFDFGNCLGGKRCVPRYTRSNNDVGTAFVNYRTCLANSKCDPNYIPFKGASTNNCAQTNCISQWQSYIDKILGNNYSECGAAWAVGPVTGLVLAAVIAAMF